MPRRLRSIDRDYAIYVRRVAPLAIPLLSDPALRHRPCRRLVVNLAQDDSKSDTHRRLQSIVRARAGRIPFAPLDIFDIGRYGFILFSPKLDRPQHSGHFKN